MKTKENDTFDQDTYRKDIQQLTKEGCSTGRRVESIDKDDLGPNPDVKHLMVGNKSSLPGITKKKMISVTETPRKCINGEIDKKH
jgi:hypothetical protein